MGDEKNNPDDKGAPRPGSGTPIEIDVHEESVVKKDGADR